MRAVDVVKKVAPKARSEYWEAFENGDVLLSKAGINTPLRLAHFMAQVMHESGGLTVTFENMNYRAPRIMQIFGEGKHSASISSSEAEHLAGKPSALAERVYGIGNKKKSKELGNVNAGDGYKFRGGGIMQTTGRANYRRMGEKCGVDFESNPELVCSADHALKPALAEWTEGKLNERADKNDLKGITRRINGGYNGLADREAWFKKIRPLIDTVDFQTGTKPYIEIAPPANAPPDVAKPEPGPPKTGITEGAKVGAGLGIAGVFSQVWEILSQAPETILQALVAMAQKPAFLIFMAVACVGGYIWWRRNNMKKAA